MVLTFEEKKKLYNKASALYEKIKERKNKREISINIMSKYYPTSSRFASCGFKYYYNGNVVIYCSGIKDMLEELVNYINWKDGTGEEYINGKSVTFLSEYTINALLDFVYYGTEIVDMIDKEIKNDKKELESLLN